MKITGATLVHCLWLAVLLLVAPLPSRADSPPSPAAGYLERAQTKTLGQVRVTATVLSADEGQAVFGAPLSSKLIQPVWVEVENRDDVAWWLLYPGLDPNFFPASEAAEAMAQLDPGQSREVLEQRFKGLDFRNPVPPGGTVSGFVLTNLHEGVKLVQVDLAADRRSLSFSFLTVVPGLRTDFEKSRETRARLLSAQGAGADYASDAELRAALEALPCCASNKSGTRFGDPLNLVIIGDVEDAFPALVRRGWSPTEVTWKGSVMRMVKSAMARERYPYAPVSNLYLFDRPQDLALQKARDNIHQRNHLRLWRSNLRYQGKPVWIGQVSRDIGSRLTIYTPTFTTHKIDPDVDEAAEALLEDMVYSEALSGIGFVKGVGEAPRSAPRRNLTFDPYFTAGLRYVLVFDRSPTSLTDIRVLPWEPARRVRPAGGKLVK